jgi:hypothetical protein
MADVDISKFRAQVVRDGFRPSNPGFVESEGQNPVDPAGSTQNHLPVTIGTPANGLAVTEAQVLTIDKAQIFAGTSSQFVKGDGTLDSNTYLTTGSAASTYVPYTGATADVNLGTHDLAAERGTFANNGSSDTLTVNHTSGSGYGIIVTKGGNNEALYVEKTSGSGNAMRVLGGRTSLVDLALSSVTNTAGDFLTLSGGVVHKRTAAEVRTDIGAGTVTSVAALTLGTSGTDLSSTVANGTTTPVITLNVPTASATNRGALSSADWSLFNGKQEQLNGTGFVKASGTTISYDNTSYLPLTGGTLTGALNGTTANFNSNSGILVGLNSRAFIRQTIGGDAEIGAPINGVLFLISNGVSVLSFGSSGQTTIANLAGSGTRMVVSDSNGLLSTQTIPLGTVTSVTASSPLSSSGGTTPNITIQQASGSQSGFLSSTDWTTFNNKQNALTNPVTGTGSAGQVAFFSGTTTLSSESNLFWDSSNNRLGIGTATPATPLHISTSGLPLIRITAGSESRVHNINAVNNGRDLSVLPFRNFSIITGNGIAEGLIVLNSYEDFIVGTGSSYTSRFQIFTDGNVSISNSPSNAGFKLDVNGTGRFSAGVRSIGTEEAFRFQRTIGSASDVYSLNADSGSAYLYNNTTAKILMNWSEGGNVAVGNGSANSTLQILGSIALPHTTKSANYTLDASDYTVGFDCASNRTATLPDATTCAGRIYVIYQYNTNTGMRYVTIDPNGSQTISGVATYPLSSYGDFSSVMIQSTGSNWVVISDALYFIPV